MKTNFNVVMGFEKLKVENNTENVTKTTNEPPVKFEENQEKKEENKGFFHLKKWILRGFVIF